MDINNIQIDIKYVNSDSIKPFDISLCFDNMIYRNKDGDFIIGSI